MNSSLGMTPITNSKAATSQALDAATTSRDAANRQAGLSGGGASDRRQRSVAPPIAGPRRLGRGSQVQSCGSSVNRRGKRSGAAGCRHCVTDTRLTRR